MRRRVWLIAGLASLVGLAICGGGLIAQEREPNAPSRDGAPESGGLNLPITASPYRPLEEVSGEIKIVGASTLQPLAGLWKEEFAKYHANAKLKLQLDGSERAAPVLAKEGAAVALVTRHYTPEEAAEIEKGHPGKKLHQFVIAYDVLGVIVNKENPIEGVTRAQARALLRRGNDTEKEIVYWGDLGVTGDFEKVKVSPHGRERSSGTRTYVKRLVLEPGEEEREQQSHTSSASIAEAVAKERGGVGYASLTHINREKVKVLGVAREEGEPFIFPTDENVVSGRYPLVRPLVLAAIGDEAGIPDATLREAIHFMLSTRGQMQALKDGFLPANRSDIVQGLDTLGVSSVK